MALTPNTIPGIAQEVSCLTSINQMATAHNNDAIPEVINTKELLHTFLLMGNENERIIPANNNMAP